MNKQHALGAVFGKGPRFRSTISSARRLRNLRVEPLELRAMLTVVAQGVQSFQATEGIAVDNALLARFTDPPGNLRAAAYSADINWGDGASSSGTIAYDASTGVYSVSGSHVYGEEGVDSVTVLVHRAGAPDASLSALATVVEQPFTGLPQTLTATAGVPLGRHSGVGYGEVIAAVRQDFSPDQEVLTTAIDWGDGVTTSGSAFVDLSLDSDIQHRTYSVFAVHTYTQPGTYAITVAFSENGAPEATVTSTAIVTGTGNQQLVDHIYRDLLGRAPDADGLAAWLAQLDQGLSRSQFVAQVEQSAEYRQDQVMAIYQQYLHRPADPVALETGSQLLAQGATDEQLTEMVVSSPEYFALHGGANDGFLAALFQDALNRPIDAGAKAAFGQALAAGANRAEIAAIVFASHEYHAEVVDAAYLQLLHRHSDAAGQSFWANLLDASVTNEQLLAALAASDEYFNRSA
ncbi:MAG TPA: DUF4214 domain-containing protein [Pirellulales bacterium]|jgi:hypothetical protein|nr:DUF4214 domain-containing protein [Pirellulales bacterium]